MSSASSDLPQPPLTTAPHSRLWAFAAILSALLLMALDQNIVGNVLPRIVGELGHVYLYAWVISGYLLTSTIAVPIAGKLGDLYGRKTILLIGIAILVLGGTLAAFAQSMTALVATRSLQGLGGGFLQASAFATIGDLLAPSERGRYMGLFTGAIAFATMVGPLIGGLIADRWGWRWVFLVDLPLGLAASFVIVRGLPANPRRGASGRFDWMGTTTFIATIVPILLACSSGKANAPEVLVSLRLPLVAFALLMFVAFLFVERRTQEPLIPLYLFTRPVFPVAIAVTFFSGGALYAVASFVPLYIQNVLGKTVTQAGIAFVPMMLSLVVSNIIGGQWLSRQGSYRRPCLVGLLVASVALFGISQLTPDSTLMHVMICLGVFGLGLGITLPMLTIATQNAVEHRYLGVATSMVQFSRTLAGSLGVASFGAILAARLDQGMARALSAVFLTATGLLGAAILVASFLRNLPLRKTNT